ncbi:MAG: flagellar basal body P-ring protein FlgI [Candidatus Hydrogenedentota bacterium]
MQSRIHYREAAVLALFVGVLSLMSPAHAARLGDVCEIQGAQGNHLRGIGIVVGLDGTGDSSEAAVVAQQRMLDRMEIGVDSLGDLSSDNSAIVMVTSEVPAFGKAGTRVDAQVSSLYDAESLEGGLLLETLLYGIDNNVYAVAQGPVSVGGFEAEGDGAGVQQNHVTAGRAPMGATIEREIPTNITDGERITLLLKQPNFRTANNIQQAINNEIAPQSAVAYGAGSVTVRIPEDRQPDLTSFVAELQSLEVESESVAKVVINERTGTIVVGGDVMIKPVQIAHGNLSIQIAETPVAAMPEPFTDADPVEQEIVDIEVTEEEAHLMPVEGASAAEVAAALNNLRVTPRDMIAIFQALRHAGALEADLEIM